MRAAAGNVERGERRLLEHLAILDRLVAGEGGTARARLDAELGPERAQFLVRALSRTPRRPSEALPPAASA